MFPTNGINPKRVEKINEMCTCNFIMHMKDAETQKKSCSL